jgi:predicted MFS family arabinose efflux permease
MLALQMSNLGFSPLLPAIRGAFHMSFAQMGLFAGMYGLLSVLWSVPAGLLAKRFGEKVVLAAGLGTVLSRRSARARCGCPDTDFHLYA